MDVAASTEALLNRFARIFHPTDLSAADETAFAHALSLAWAAGSELTLFHVADGGASPGRPAFPSVRSWLARWGQVPPNASRRDVVARGLDVKKIDGRGEPLEALAHRLERHPADLVVLDTRAYSGHRLAGPLARRSRTLTLFLPEGARGFVDPASGRVRLRRVLLPLAARPDPRRGVEAASAVATVLGARDVAFTLLHAGAEQELPLLDLPTGPGWQWRRLVAAGHPVDLILSAVERLHPDLIVMPTAGRRGILDALRGSTSERVLRRAGCPLLAVPE